jgi:hypothetical protein
MVLVRMGVSLYAKATLVPGAIKQPPVEWIGDDQVEGYVNSEGILVLEIHRGKIKIDDAKKKRPETERQIHYNESQIGKINKELQEGRLGRKGDLSKFEAKLSELRDEMRIATDLIDSAIVDRIEFPVEDCN